MKISNQHTIFVRENTKQDNQSYEKMHKKEKNVDCFAGNLNSDLFENKLLEKKKEAREKAMKVIEEAFTGDGEIDNNLQERRDKIVALELENKELQNQIDEISESQNALMEQYGITADSQEQKDLELLRKKDKCLKGEGEALSEEELERISTLESEGLTEYQKRQREWDAEKEYFQKDIDKNKEEIVVENAIIRETKLERLKNDPMVKAQKEAKEILKNASREIINMIAEEAKDTIEEKNEEEKKKAEKIEEIKEEKEAFVEKQKEKKEETDDLIENMPMEEMIYIGQLKEEIKQEIQKIVSDMKLVAEDIKGAVVDQIT